MDNVLLFFYAVFIKCEFTRRLIVYVKKGGTKINRNIRR